MMVGDTLWDLVSVFFKNKSPYLDWGQNEFNSSICIWPCQFISPSPTQKKDGE